MTYSLLQKRKKIHRKVVLAMAGAVATVTSFVLIFSTLLLLSNWPAYSRILQDIIDPQAMAVVQDESDDDVREHIEQKVLEQELKQEHQKLFSVDNVQKKDLFSIGDIGEMYPNEMRLEVPKVFKGTVPIKNVDIESFNFKDLYESENKIQLALREGVVHYPFTADPDQYGNVFITGHSSYTPWDPGRYKDIFALLHKLDAGDQYFITFKGKKYSYTVTEVFEIQPDDISVLEQPVDKKISTLMTCTPVGTNLRRLIVRAELTDVQ